MSASRVYGILAVYSRFVEFEGVSPLQGGLLRLKYRRDRSPTFPKAIIPNLTGKQ
jgi:hypothetical protein